MLYSSQRSWDYESRHAPHCQLPSSEDLHSRFTGQPHRGYYGIKFAHHRYIIIVLPLNHKRSAPIDPAANSRILGYDSSRPMGMQLDLGQLAYVYFTGASQSKLSRLSVEVSCPSLRDEQLWIVFTGCLGLPFLGQTVRSTANLQDQMRMPKTCSLSRLVVT